MIDHFLGLLAEATSRIREHYFRLPVADLEDPIFRERVYTYELYHQLRLLFDADHAFTDYVLSGEIDKGGHPIIRRCAPDFVLHQPGRMDGNLAVIEVKPANGDVAGIQKDRETLEYFVSDQVGYRVGIELVYGGTEGDMENFIQVFDNLPCQIQLFWHRLQGEPAIKVQR